MFEPADAHAAAVLRRRKVTPVLCTHMHSCAIARPLGAASSRPDAASAAGPQASVEAAAVSAVHRSSAASMTPHPAGSPRRMAANSAAKSACTLRPVAAHACALRDTAMMGWLAARHRPASAQHASPRHSLLPGPPVHVLLPLALPQSSEAALPACLTSKWGCPRAAAHLRPSASLTRRPGRSPFVATTNTTCRHACHVQQQTHACTGHVPARQQSKRGGGPGADMQDGAACAAQLGR